MSHARRHLSRPALAALTAALLFAAPTVCAAATPPARPQPPAHDARALAPDTRFATLGLTDDRRAQLDALVAAHRYADAALLRELLAVPTSFWFEGGTPDDVRAQMRDTLAEADRQHAVPVLVVYNLPYRDCLGYSSGGTSTAAAYREWIDAFATALGRHKAVVIVETDGLGIIPFSTDLRGGQDWCKPMLDDAPAPEADPEHRYALINHAVDVLTALPATRVYLDGTNAHWLGAGEAAYRLDQAGVRKAQGFFVNTSAFSTRPANQTFGTWVSKCLAAVKYGVATARGRYDLCEGPYGDNGLGYDDPDYVAWVDAQYDALLGEARPTTHFVIDTSRSGRGEARMQDYAAAPYGQPADVVTTLQNGAWCNPRGAGAGERPTTRTASPLVDAYLWIKIPGESDGTCDAAGGARAWDYTAYNPWNLTADQQQTFDPLWGRTDPAAGEWFGEQALELARNAVPPLTVHPRRPGRVR